MSVASAGAHAVAEAPDGRSPGIPHSARFVGEEAVLAMRRQQHEQTAVPQIVHVGQAGPLPACPCPLRYIHAVPLDELAIDGGGILGRGNATGHMEPASVRDVRHRELLHEPLDRLRLTPVHRPPR
jgi:hypothetical protein